MWPFKRKKSTEGSDSIDVNKPVTNPDLKLAFRAFNSNKSEQTVLKVVTEIKKSYFLILIDQDGLKTSKTSDEGIITIEEGSILRFLKIFDERGNAFIPIFTDWKEVDLWISNRKNVSSWIMKASDAFDFVLRNDVVGLVINPCSDKWDMNKEQINNFLKEI